MKRQERGNILFLILLAVVLFAALSYAVTSSMKGGGNNASEESVRVQAAAVIQAMDQIDVAVLRMQMSKGIAPENISFRYDAAFYGGTVISNYMNNTNCTTDACRVFEPDGGGASPPFFDKAATPEPTGANPGVSLAPGVSVLQVIQWPYAKTDANDIVLQSYYLKPAVCEEINRQLGITAIPTLTGTAVQGHVPANWDNAARTISSNATSLIGKNMFAGGFSGTGSGQSCFLYRLVIAR